MTSTPIVHDPGVGRRKMLLSGVRAIGFDERAVLRELGELGWRDGECFAAVKTLAQRMGGTVYRIRKALHSLIGQGLIVAEERTAATGPTPPGATGSSGPRSSAARTRS